MNLTGVLGEFMWFFMLIGVVVFITFFVQRKVYIHANRMVFKIMPFLVFTGLFISCCTTALIKIQTIKSTDFYIQMSVDEVEVMYTFYGAVILAAIMGCILGIATHKIINAIRNQTQKIKT